jgi:HAMP domain-containing protein
MPLRRSTKIWLALLLGGVASILLGALAWNDGPFLPLGILALTTACIAFLVRAVRWLARKLFYRLSWRLAFSYFLIGVLPVPLLTLLLGTAAYLAVGQFEAFRVRQAIERLGEKMVLGEIPGVRTARARLGRVERSTIPELAVGADVRPWVGRLRAPKFFGQAEPVYLAVAVRRGDADDIYVVSDREDVFYARVAEESGVAILPAAATGVAEQRATGVEIRFPSSESARVRRMDAKGDRIYPPEAIPEDRSPSPLKSVQWFYLSRPVLLSSGTKTEENVTTLVLRMSWRRALTDLFSQETIRFGGDRDTFSVAGIIRVVMTVLAALLLCVYLAALLIAYLLIRTITKTVNRLSWATRRVGAGDFAVRVGTKARDQVGDLAQSFDSMAGSLEATVAEHAARELLDLEIDQARTISQKLLPRPDASVPGLAVETVFEPIAAIGGDYYDFLTTSDGKTAVAIGDVSGHGLPTALLVAMAKGAIDTLLESGERGTPLFSKLNALLHRSTDNRNYMTLSLAVLDTPGEIELTNAGHPPPYLVASGDVRALALPAFPLGASPRTDFPTARYPFRPGDRLVFYTDGIIEARGAGDEAFGFDRLEAVLRREAGSTGSAMKNAVLDAVAAHCAGGTPDDDRTLVICERV